MILGVFAPWGKLTIEILGVQSPALEFRGDQIGSDIGSVPWGYFMLGAGAIGLAGAARSRRLAVGAGASGCAFAALNLLTLNASHVSATVGIGGQTNTITESLNPHVSWAWGSPFVLVASLALLVSALNMAGEPTEMAPAPPEPGSQQGRSDADRAADAASRAARRQRGPLR